MSEIKKVIDIALNEVGYIEKASNKELDSETANAGKNNYTKYARDLDNITGFYNGKKNGYDWCDVFVDWCFVEALGKERAMELLNQPEKSCGAGCGFSMKYYKKINQFFDKPKKGDQIFFTDGSSIYHTGLVYKVDNSRVYTIEGNTKPVNEVVGNGGQVCKKSYPLGASYIAGYGRPKYDETIEKVEENPTKKSTTVLEWQKVMNKCYNCGLEEDNSYGPDSKSKADKYYLHYEMPTIKNEHVKFIQERLNHHGFKTAIDKSYGIDCKSKVKAFQKVRGLDVDGFVGAKTTEELLKD